MREEPTFPRRMNRLLLGGIIGVVLGALLAWSDMCPLVKRIWTPSFVLYSGGCCLLWLAALHWICDQFRLQRWAYPFIVIGANSILIYVMSWTIAGPTRDMLIRHFGTQPFAIFGEPLVPLLSGAATMAVLIAVLWWLYRKRVFVKI